MKGFRHILNNSLRLHLARKYAQIFVRGHYLFREANSFPRAKLEENCELRGADNVQGQISDRHEHIFKSQMEAIVVNILQIFFATCSNELEYLNISFNNTLPSKTLGAYVVF